MAAMLEQVAEHGIVFKFAARLRSYFWYAGLAYISKALLPLT
jgi:hypothetical protein